MATLTETPSLSLSKVDLSSLSESGQDEEIKIQLIPSIIVFCGPPAVGKSTVGKELADHSNAILLDVDQTRGRLFGYHPAHDPEIERQEMAASYRENYRLAEAELAVGIPVILVATYSSEVSHKVLRQFAEKTKVPLKIFSLSVKDEAQIAARLANRQTGQAGLSNITSLDQYLVVKNRFKVIDHQGLVEIDADQPKEEIYKNILSNLKDLYQT